MKQNRDWKQIQQNWVNLWQRYKDSAKEKDARTLEVQMQKIDHILHIHIQLQV